MKTSLIILFKNELEYAEITIKKVYEYLLEYDISFEIIVVDDSTDGTWEILQEYEIKYQNVVVIRGDSPPGYGNALRKGLSFATGDILIPFNGDLSDSLDDVITYINLIEDGYDMVFGSRFISDSRKVKSTVLKESISRLGNSFIQLLFQVSCSDITNSFKAYRRIVIEDIKLTAHGYNVGMELALKGIIHKYKFITIPIDCLGREYGQSKMSMIKIIPSYLYTAFKIRIFQNL